MSVLALYQYKTALTTFGQSQKLPDQLVAERGETEYLPIVYDFCWNTGVHGYATIGPVDFGVAALNGSLGSPAREINHDRPNVAAHVTVHTGPYASFGMWGGVGPYLTKDLEPQLPAGTSLESFEQRTLGASTHFSYGHWEGYAEGMVNRFEHPFFGNLDNMGGYADLTWSFAPRWHLAGRVDHLSFARTESLQNQRWDYPLSRYEFGVGRWLSEKSLVKLVSQTVRYTGAPTELDDEVYALQFTVKM